MNKSRQLKTVINLLERLLLIQGSLKVKLTRLIVLVALISVFLGGIVIVTVDIAQFKQDFSDKMSLIAKTVGNYSAVDIEFKDQKAAKQSLAKLQQIPSIINVHLYDNSGEWFISLRSGKDIPQLSAGLSKITEVYSDETLTISTPIYFNEQKTGYLKLIASTKDMGDKVTQRFLMLGLLGLVLSFIAYTLASWLQAYVSSPILELADSAKNIAENPDYSQRVSHVSGNEIGILYDSFNKMLETIEEKEQERERALNELSKSEARFSAMFNAIPDAVLFVDTKRKIRLNNPAVFALFNYNNEELIGNTTKMLYKNEGDYLEQGRVRFNKNKENPSPVYEIQYKRKDGSIFWSETLGTKVITSDSVHIGYLGIIRDITERKRAEQELKQYKDNLEKLVAERTKELQVLNKELKTFNYSVSHDLRSPLRSIDGFSLALLEDYKDKLDREGKDYLFRIRAATQRMGYLIDDMLQLSRVTSHNVVMQKVNLTEEVNTILTQLIQNSPERKSNINVQSNLSAYGDRGLLAIMLNNLIGNAWKYSEKKENTSIEFGKSHINGEDVFFIKDNGDGFDMQYAHQLFTPFQRLHGRNEFSGTGIGLAIVKRVINRHEGKIWAEAEPQKGACFYFTLPDYHIV